MAKTTAARGIRLNGRAALVGAGLLVALVVTFWFAEPEPHYIDPQTVWRQAVEEGARHGLDPAFIYAVCFAESSLNARADSRYARGIMQMSHAAWRRVSERPWEQAWDWRANMAAAADYMAVLRAILEERGQFSYPNLAAAYRYGIGTLIEADFDLGRMPQPRNEAYRAIFAGDWESLRPFYGTNR